MAEAVLSHAWQVSGDSMVKGLRLALEAAPDAAAARSILQGFALAIRLAGVVGLDELCLRFVEGISRTSFINHAITSLHMSPGTSFGVRRSNEIIILFIL